VGGGLSALLRPCCEALLGRVKSVQWRGAVHTWPGVTPGAGIHAQCHDSVMIELTLFNDATWICKARGNELAPSKAVPCSRVLLRPCPYLQARICNNAQTLHPQSAMCRQMVEEKVPLYARSSRRAPQQCAVPVLLTRRRTLPGLRLLEWLKLPNSITASEFCTRIKLILH